MVVELQIVVEVPQQELQEQLILVVAVVQAVEVVQERELLLAVQAVQGK